MVIALYRYLTPPHRDDDAKVMRLDTEKDNYTGCWTDWCQRGEAAGWYVVRRAPGPDTTE